MINLKYFDIKASPTGVVGLIAIDAETEQWLKGKLANGETKTALASHKVRDIDTHRRYFEVIKLFTDNASEKLLCELLKLNQSEYLELGQSQIPDLVRKQLLVKLGHTTTKDAKINVGGYVADVKYTEAKSIAFDQLEENEFRALHAENKALVFDLLRGEGWDNEQLRGIFKDFFNK